MAWQTVDSGRLLLLTFTSLLVVVAFARTVSAPFYARDVAVAFGLYIAFGELLRLVLARGGEAAPIAVSAAPSYPVGLPIARPPPRLLPGWDPARGAQAPPPFHRPLPVPVGL